jgi:tetratricopeptide (TPR) repeat protein
LDNIGLMRFKSFRGNCSYGLSLRPNTEVMPMSPDELHERGTAHFAKGEYALAIADFTEVIRLRLFSDAFDDRGNAYLANGEPDLALADYAKVIRRDPGSARAEEAIENRRKVYLAKGEPVSAVASYSRGLPISPRMRTTTPSPNLLTPFVSIRALQKRSTAAAEFITWKALITWATVAIT